MKRRLCVLGLLVVIATGVRADEIRLKDGSKIVGTIVDFQDDSFKVQTAYGFAMVRKNSIAQIIPETPASTAEVAKAPVSAGTLRPAVARSATPSTAVSPVTRPASSAALPMPAPNPRRTAPATMAAVPPVPVVEAPPALASETAAVPPPPIMPAPIRESVQGNLYTNETYNFQLYRPPGWELMPEARQALPNAITAMGTSDQSALFVIGREPLRDSLEAQADTAQRALQKVYENYRQISSTKRTVSGLPAVEWRFRGLADGHDWSVTALTVASGNDAFTLLGMAYADSDPVMQIRENVIAKIITSMEFSAPR